jgi:hypothetical protein
MFIACAALRALRWNPRHGCACQSVLTSLRLTEGGRHEPPLPDRGGTKGAEADDSTAGGERPGGLADPRSGTRPASQALAGPSGSCVRRRGTVARTVTGGSAGPIAGGLGSRRKPGYGRAVGYVIRDCTHRRGIPSTLQAPALPNTSGSRLPTAWHVSTGWTSKYER